MGSFFGCLQNDEQKVMLKCECVFQGKATGNTCALRIRAYLQTRLFSLGCFIQKHCGKVLFIGLLLLSLCCLGLKTASIETNVEKLWVEGKSEITI